MNRLSLETFRLHVIASLMTQRQGFADYAYWWALAKEAASFEELAIVIMDANLLPGD